MAKLPVTGLEVFLAIAEHGSLRRAANALAVQPPAISHQLKSLEAEIGVAVFARTTRRVTLTDAGRALLKRTKPAMVELREAVEEARGSATTRSGAIRVSIPYVAYQLAVAHKLAEFQKRFPDVELELSLNEAFVDIALEGYHAGVRMGDHIREDMIAVRLTPPLKQVFFASPTYLKSHGRPQEPQDLLQHCCIRYRYIASRKIAEWEVQGSQGITSIDVKGGLVVDSTNAVILAARSGSGIGWLFRPNIEEDLKSGALESVLDDYVIERPGYFLYYPKSHARMEVLRIFVDFMKDQRSKALSETLSS